MPAKYNDEEASINKTSSITGDHERWTSKNAIIIFDIADGRFGIRSNFSQGKIRFRVVVEFMSCAKRAQDASNYTLAYKEIRFGFVVPGLSGPTMPNSFPIACGCQWMCSSSQLNIGAKKKPGRTNRNRVSPPLGMRNVTQLCVGSIGDTQVMSLVKLAKFAGAAN